MLEDFRPGQVPSDGAATPVPEAIPLEREAVEGDVFKPHHGRSVTVLGVAVALALHAGVAVGVLAGWIPSADQRAVAGADGTDLAAISVEISVVPSLAIDSREKAAEAADAGHNSMAAVEGTVVAEALEQPDPEPSETPQLAAATAPSEPVAPPPAALTTTDEPSQPDPEAPALPASPLPPTVTAALVAPEKPVEPEPERKPEPDPVIEPKPPEPTPKEATPAPPAVEAPPPSAGGGGSTGQAAVPQRAKAAASAGAARAFARNVAQALERTRPSGESGQSKGTVRIAFTIAESGGLESVEVATTSGRGDLDRRALEAVRRARFPQPPSGLTRVERTYTVPYHFR